MSGRLIRPSDVAPNPYFAVFGHSMMEQTWYATNGMYFSSPIPWAIAASGGRIKFRAADNFGVSGQTSAQIAARVDAMLAATDASTIVVMATTNDRTGGALTYAQTVANLATIEAAILAASRRLIFVIDGPRGDGTASDTGQTLSGTPLKDHLGTAAYLRSRRNIPGVYVVDPWPKSAAVDSGYTQGRAKAGELYDGLHMSRMAKRIGDSIAAVAATFLAPAPPYFASSIDTYDATSNPLGSITLNPMLLGTGGTKGDGSATGNVADSFTTAAIGSVASGVSAAYSKVTTSTGDWQQIVLSGTVGGTGTKGINLLVQGKSGLTIGDKYYAVAEMEIDAGSTGLLGIGPQAVETTGYTAQNALYANNANATWPAEAVTGQFVSQPITLPGTGAEIDLRCWVLGGATLSATIRVRGLGLIKA